MNKVKLQIARDMRKNYLQFKIFLKLWHQILLNQKKITKEKLKK